MRLSARIRLNTEAAAWVVAEVQRMEALLQQLGVCVDCLEVREMAQAGPTASCGCCKNIPDLGEKPLQQLQLIERVIQELHQHLPPENNNTLLTTEEN